MNWIRGMAAIVFIGPVLAAADSAQAQANSLSDAAARWRERAESERAALANETFAQSLWQMIDYESNMRQVGSASSQPPLPESLIWIVRARRFARLVEDFRGPDVTEHRKVAHTQLAADLERWAKLHKQGNDITGGGIWSGPGLDPQTLILPLTIRIHATVLLLAQNPDESSLDPVLEYVHTFGVDTNWALAGFAARRVLESTSPRTRSAKQADVLRQLEEYCQRPEVKAIADPRRITLPSHRATFRPGDPASSLGIRDAGADPGAVTIDSPTSYTVHVLADQTNGKYHDPKGGNEINRDLVDLAIVFAQNRPTTRPGN